MKNLILLLFLTSFSFHAQENWDKHIDTKLPDVLFSHKEFVSIPNLPVDIQKMYQNISWVKTRYKKVGFK